jgi:hypothetical protein
VTLRYLAGFTGTEGVLYVGRAQEKATVWRTQRRYHAGGSSWAWLVKTSALVNYFYFYCVDADFGPFFLKFCTYLCVSTGRLSSVIPGKWTMEHVPCPCACPSPRHRILPYWVSPEHAGALVRALLSFSVRLAYLEQGGAAQLALGAPARTRA